MRKMEKKKAESVQDLDFYQLNAAGLNIQWALAQYPDVVLVILRHDMNFSYFENPVSRAMDSSWALEFAEQMHRAVWRAELWGFIPDGISEMEMNSVLLKHSHPQLFFL